MLRLPSNASHCRKCGSHTIPAPKKPNVHYTHKMCPKGCGPVARTVPHRCDFCGTHMPGAVRCPKCGRKPLHG